MWFDPDRSVGAIEFTFGDRGEPTADHDVAVVEVTDGLISQWREYHRKGPARLSDFVATEGKCWQWHGGNYP